MLSTLIFFNEPFTNIITITFTALVITELLNVYSEVTLTLLNILFIDKQAELEDAHSLTSHFCLLHPQHFSP
jgi:hypothetical protein